MKALYFFLSLSLLAFFNGCPGNSSNPITPGQDGFSFANTRSYTLSTATATTVQDSVSGVRFVFPSGAHGVLNITAVNLKSSISMVGDEKLGFKVVFSGSEALRVVVPSGLCACPQMRAWMKPRPLAHDQQANHWVAVPRVDSNATEVSYLILTPKSITLKGANTIQDASTSGAEVYSLTEGSFTAEALMSMNVNTEIRALRATMPAATQTLIDNGLKRIPAIVYTVPPSGVSAYTPYWGLWGGNFTYNGSLELRSNIEPQRITHEVGHYMHHLLRGDAEFKTAMNTAKSAEAASHGIGDAYDRKTILEEYPYYFEYLRNGSVSVSGSDHFDPENPMSSNMFLQWSFMKTDFPSLEGFGACMLAQLHSSRGGVLTKYYDDNNKLVTSTDPIPIMSVPHSDICSALMATGFLSTDELYAKMSAFLQARGDASALPILMERIGWSYKVKGRLLWKSSEIEPIAKISIQALMKSGTTEYYTPEAVTKDDGTFVLPRCFPTGTVTLHIKIGAQTFLSSFDTVVTITDFDLTRKTNETLTIGDIAIEPPKVESPAGRWEVMQLILQAPGCSSCGATSFGSPLSMGGRFFMQVDGLGVATSDGYSGLETYENGSVSGSVHINPKYRLSTDQRYIVHLNYNYTRTYSNADLHVQGNIDNTATSGSQFTGSLSFTAYEDNTKAKVSCSCANSPTAPATVAKVP